MKYQFIYTGELPTNNDILISCSIFKLKNMYKKFEKYINGLVNLIYTVLLNNIKLIVYYDDSIKDDIEFNNIFNTYKNKIIFCYYKFNDFIDEDGYHKGLFGTFVRISPIFLKEINYKCLYVSDVDHPIDYYNYIIYSINKFIKSKYNFGVIYKIGYEYNYNNYYSIPNTNISIILNIYTKKKYYNIKTIFINFLQKINNNDKEILDIIKNKVNITNDFLNKYDTGYKTNKQIKYADINIFSYGIDELFINREFMPYIIKKEDNNIGVIYVYDNLKYYIHNILDNDIVSDKIYKKIYDNIINNINDISNDILLMNSNKFKQNRKYYGRYDKYNKEHLNKLIYIITNSIGNNNDKLSNLYIILKIFIKNIIKLYKKYPNKKINTDKWILNLKLHKHKGLIKNVFNEIIKKDLLKIYSFTKLLNKKTIF